MRSVSIVLLALATQAIAFPSTSLNKRQVPDADTGDEPVNQDALIWSEPVLAAAPPVLARRQATSTTSRTSTSSTTARTSSSSTTTRTSSSSTSTTRTTVSTSTTRSTTSTTTTGARTVDAAAATTSSKTTTSTSKSTTLQTTTTTSKVSSTTSKTTTAAQATRTIDVTGMTYQQALLTAHNVHRANHSIPALVWNQGLADTAQRIADSCKYGHNVDQDGGGYGQNIGAGAPGNQAAGLVTNLMYNNEIGYYPKPYGVDDADMTNFHIWGHYSQLVWSDTTDVGCVTKYCPNGLANTGPGVAPYFTVCNYSPPGNYVGEFSSVAAPGGGATVIIVGT